MIETFAIISSFVKDANQIDDCITPSKMRFEFFKIMNISLH